MKKTGDGRRIERVQKEVAQVLSRFLMGTFKGDLPGIVTVTRVMMPADLRNARVQVAILNGTPEQNELAAEMLQERAVEMQHYLAKQLPLRYTPKLQFFADNSLEKVLKIDRILHDIGQKSAKDIGTSDEDDE